MYHYAKSTIKVNPIRLAVRLIFPNQDDAEFNLDLELRGVSQQNNFKNNTSIIQMQK